MDLNLFNKKALELKKENETFFKKIKFKKNIKLDDVFHKTHNEVFEKTDCLKCANCCKTTSPIFYQLDIERAAKALKIKPGDFIKTYLMMDEEGDFVFTKAPCPFLDNENYCLIYKDRPTACREYPHTNRKNIRQILNLTYNNTLVCPAVLTIVEKVKKQINIK
ncbi:MAG: YkgJ family cysteine cluster protein [Bacteroidetes bacterium]|nr:YkgJ family cysteine cluster protein [Bacteroidota bacterium]